MAALTANIATLRNAWAGMIVEWEAETIPVLADGLPKGLELDGSIVSLATYPRLLAKYCGDASNADAPAWYKCTDTGTRDTAGAYMRLQDRRGEFARGWDHGRGADVGRALGSQQGAASADMYAAAVVTPSGGYRYLEIDTPLWAASYQWGAYSRVAEGGGYTKGVPVLPSGTGETRPRNIATMYIVLI
jgi:hypothetical protein